MACTKYTTINTTPNISSYIVDNSGSCGQYGGITTCYLERSSTSNSADAYSGFAYSDSSTKNTAKTLYTSPTSISTQSNLTSEQKLCNGQGIYVLTDGSPNLNNYTSGLAVKALGSKGSAFSCLDSATGWNCTHKMAEALLDPAKNPTGLAFKTAVVGFGSSFNEVASYDSSKSIADNLVPFVDANGNKLQNLNDQQNAAYWGIKSEGGWYAGSNASDVSKSINEFVEKK